MRGGRWGRMLSAKSKHLVELAMWGSNKISLGIAVTMYVCMHANYWYYRYNI